MQRYVSHTANGINWLVETYTSTVETLKLVISGSRSVAAAEKLSTFVI